MTLGPQQVTEEQFCLSFEMPTSPPEGMSTDAMDVVTTPYMEVGQSVSINVP